MAYGVCLIAAGLPAPSQIEDLIRLCGLEVWTPDSVGADDGRIYSGALCMVIDMPREAGFKTFRLFRDHGVETPVLLIVDPGLEEAMGGLNPNWGLRVVSRSTGSRDILGHIEMMCRERRPVVQCPADGTQRRGGERVVNHREAHEGAGAGQGIHEAVVGH